MVPYELQVERLVTLVRWLARSYGDNDPVFSFTAQGGSELTGNVEHARTWYDVVRGGDYPATLIELLAGREATLDSKNPNDANGAS